MHYESLVNKGSRFMTKNVLFRGGNVIPLAAPHDYPLELP